jgi:stage V sporulation protein S
MDLSDPDIEAAPLSVGILIERSKGGKVVNVLRIGAHSDPNKVAGALAGTIREQGRAEMQTIGAGALNQAIKSIAIARGFLAPSGVDLVCYPAFVDVEVDGNERTAIRLFVEPKGH